jgi:hypothetical protein
MIICTGSTRKFEFQGPHRISPPVLQPTKKTRTQKISYVPHRYPTRASSHFCVVLAVVLLPRRVSRIALSLLLRAARSNCLANPSSCPVHRSWSPTHCLRGLLGVLEVRAVRRQLRACVMLAYYVAVLPGLIPNVTVRIHENSKNLNF